MQCGKRALNRHLSGLYLQKLLAANLSGSAKSKCLASTAEVGVNRTAQGDKRSKWGWLMLAPSVVAAYLGYWQTERYYWKVDLLESRRSGLEAPATPISDLPENPKEHTKAVGEGEFLLDKSVYIGPRPKTINGNPTAGYILITPFLVDQFRSPVLVNRGWVPASWKTNPESRKQNNSETEMPLEGLVRISEPRSVFVPDNVPEKDAWYWIDVPAIAKKCGLPPETPLIEVYSDGPSETRSNIPTSVDVLAMKGKFSPQKNLYPMRKPYAELLDVSVKPVDHRNYALIWITLSASTALLGLRAIRKH